jgi:hypothetical protein
MDMCRHAQDGFADSPIQTVCTLFHGRYFIDTNETRFLGVTFYIAAHYLKFLCTLHKKIEVVCIIPQHNRNGRCRPDESTPALD